MVVDWDNWHKNYTKSGIISHEKLLKMSKRREKKAGIFMRLHDFKQVMHLYAWDAGWRLKSQEEIKHESPRI